MLPLVGCASTASPDAVQETVAPKGTAEGLAGLQELEWRFDARIGVHAIDTGTGRSIAHRDDERFAFCSTYKAIAAAEILRSRAISGLEKRVRFTADDLVSYSPVTEQRVASGMSLRELCVAAVRFSDNTAGNLLFRELGGPQGMASALREIGDDVTVMERIEPELNTAIPSETRDTSTPRMLVRDLQAYATTDLLPIEKRSILRGWMSGNATGDALIRAGLPDGWTVADKSGAGAYATRNDIGIVFPPGKASPIVIAVLTSKLRQDATYDNEVIAEATRLVLDALT